MLLLNQKVEIKWHPKNKCRLEELGYKYTGIGNSVFVDVKDVSHGSKSLVKVQCDYCGKIYEKRYKDYFYQRDNGKDCCKSCASIERSETNLIKYGGKSPSCSREVREKQENTSISKYGVKYPIQLPEIREKIKNTFLEKYGVETPSKNEAVKEKMKNTCKERYGGNSCQCSPEVRAKTMNTRRKNGNFPSSKQEIQMVENLKYLYGEENCTSQYILDRISFDCLVVVEGIKIDVEYDCIYWHQDIHKDIRRDYFTIGNGFKVLRFRSKNKIPSLEQIQDGVNYLVGSEHHHLIMEI